MFGRHIKKVRFQKTFKAESQAQCALCSIRKLYLKRKRYLLAPALVSALAFFWYCLPSSLFEASYSTVLLDRAGNLLGAAIAEDDQWRFPPSADVPDKFIQALTCFEDRRFFYHPGVDPLAVGRAFWLNIRSGCIVSGASTITMQVIRLSRPGQPRNLKEKLLEMIMALRLEIAYSKKEILSLYAAHAPFGGNVVGIEAAAWRYFGRPPDKLSWAESAMLAVLPNNPALIHPGKNRQQLLRKRNALLVRLQQDKVIDSLTCSLAQKEPLPPKPVPIPRLAPHLLDRIRLTKPAAASVDNHKENKAANDNHRIRTTLDRELQVRASAIVNRHHERLAANGINNAAALIMEVDSANVLAYVGNVTDFSRTENGQQVDIIPAPRSTGSILKPLLYAAMLDSGEMLPAQLVPDIPTRIGGFAPQNYSRTYQGAVPAATALARSLNVPAVRMLQSYGVDRFYTLLNKLGMTTLYRSANDYGLSLILGGAEGSLWGITGIYAGLARCVNHFSQPNRNYASVLSPPVYLWRQPASSLAKDSSAADHPLYSKAEELMGPAACWLTLQAMLEVTRPDAESAWKNFASSRKLAWKTGTSYGYRDGWAVGVTPRYAIGVWVGNADGEGRPGLTGISSAGPILFELFGLLDSPEWFAKPEADLFEATVCAYSGQRAGPYCDKTRKAWITRAGLHSRRCSYCRIAHLDADLAYRVNSECERVAAIKAVSWFVLPPAMEWYYKKKHSDYRRLPPYRSDCIATLEAFQTQSLSIIYPDNKGEIYIPIELDGRRGRAVLEAAHRDPLATIFWHLDDRYIGATRELHQMAIAPAPGKHVLTLVDENGEQVRRIFTVLAKD
jgi:penicillin-binding protein 1C